MLPFREGDFPLFLILPLFLQKLRILSLYLFWHFFICFSQSPLLPWNVSFNNNREENFHKMSHRKLIKLFPRLKLSPTHHLMMMFSGLRLVQWSLSGAQRALLVPVCCWYGAGPVWTASGHLGLLPSLPGPQRLPQNWWWEERGFSGPNITFKKLVQIIWRMADFISKSETRSLHKLSDMLIWWSPPLHNQYTRVLRRRDGKWRGKYI